MDLIKTWEIMWKTYTNLTWGTEEGKYILKWPKNNSTTWNCNITKPPLIFVANREVIDTIYHHPQDTCTNILWGMHILRVWRVPQCGVWSFLTNNDTRSDMICSEWSTLFWGIPSGWIWSAEGWWCQHALGLLTLRPLWRKQPLTTVVCVDKPKGSHKTNGNTCVLANPKNVSCIPYLSYANLPKIITVPLKDRDRHTVLTFLFLSGLPRELPGPGSQSQYKAEALFCFLSGL